MDEQKITYRTATAANVDAIFKIFEEVAPVVPTQIFEHTKESVKGSVELGDSLVALDANGKVVGYALAESGKDGIELVYLGVTATSQGKGVCSGIIAGLKERDVPINSAVRHNNKGLMADRFKRLGFKVHDKQVLENQTKFRWEPKATQPSSPARG